MCSFQGTVSSLIFYICLTFMVLRPVDQLLSVSGDKGIRTLDPLLARQVLSQLSYTPRACVFCFNGVKRTRTSDLTLIRRAL